MIQAPPRGFDRNTPFATLGSNNRQRGFTLLEAITTLGVVATLLSAGIPALTRMQAKQTLAITQNQLIGHLGYARDYAIANAQRVVLCPSADQASCSPKPDWHQGWLVFEDSNANRERDAEETLLRVGRVSAIGITVTSARSRRRLSYLPSGFSPGSNATIAICDSRQRAAPRTIIISNTGRVRSAKRGPRGTAIRCPTASG